ncbi:CHASE2 domain-containing protein [Methylobacterium oryzisoli]|uniref:CHASE2 domain-containing protein n=1 Tax=Methylobacterium oryzisoli TaxID=3385502 RepID=UPI003892A832
MTPRWPSPSAWLTAGALALALAWSFSLIPGHLRGEASVLDRIEGPLADLRFLLAGPRPAPDGVVVIAIDDETVRAAGAYPLPRAVMARLVRTLAEASPKALAVDVLFADPGPPEADEALARALATAPAIVAMAATFARGGAERAAQAGPYTDLPVAEHLLRPTRLLAQVGALGLVNVATDHGGTPRHIPLLVAADGTLHASLSLRAAALGLGQEPDLARDAVRLEPVATPLDVGASLALRFYGPQGSIRTLSARTVLDGTFSRENIVNKILIVGATALGSGDTLATPFDPVLPGVEVLATGIAHLVTGDALVRTTAIRRIDAAAALILPAVILLLISSRRIGIGLVLSALVLTAASAVAAMAFARGIWLSMALPLAATIVPVVPYAAARLWLDQRQERRLEAARAALLRFHAPALAARLAETPDFLDVPVVQRAAVLFVDLSGFTGLAERLGPERTRERLKAMHELVEEEVTARDGSVTSFMGDGAMVLFGLPEARDDDAARAVATALTLHARLTAWLAEDVTEGAIGVRIGVHAGPVVMSRLGGAHNQHITATGDTVNVASRLLEITKQHGAPVAFSAEVLAALDALPAGLSAPLPVVVRGRVEPLTLRLWRPTKVA